MSTNIRFYYFLGRNVGTALDIVLALNLVSDPGLEYARATLPQRLANVDR